MNITSVTKNIFAENNIITQIIDENIANPEQLNAHETQESGNSIIIKFSEEAIKKAEEMLNSGNMNIESLMRQAETARQQGEAIAENFEILRKCLIIAMRIISGDKVPVADHKYLAEKNPGLYGKALMLKVTRDDPREYKRVSEDEENGGISAVSGESADAYDDIDISEIIND